MKTLSRGLLVSSLALVGALHNEAAAQEAEPVDLPRNIDATRFEPSFAGDRFLGVMSPYASSEGIFEFHGGLMLDYANNAVVARSVTERALACGDTVCPVVAHQLLLHINATGVLFDRLSVNVNMPLVLNQTVGPAITSETKRTVPPTDAGPADLRVGLRGRIFGEYRDPFQLGVGAVAWLPTGATDDFITDGTIRVQPHALVGGRADMLVWSVTAGPTFRTAAVIADGVTAEHELHYGVGLGVLLLKDKSLQIGVESQGDIGLSDVSGRNMHIEAQAALKYRIVNFLEMGIGLGPGLTSAVGTPQVRTLLSLQYTPEPIEPNDEDGDSVLDQFDACPLQEGVKSKDPEMNGCPPKDDQDGDHIVDSQDRCPTEPGPANAVAELNGCPPKPEVFVPPPAAIDTDSDNILDKVDACPMLAGLESPNPEVTGCPPDADGIPDEVDACPRDKGSPSPDSKRNGCPSKLDLTDGEIVTLEPVAFEGDKKLLKQSSLPVLDQIAQLLKDHPEILKLELQVHTNDGGNAAASLETSKSQAALLMTSLVGRGIDQNRLIPVGAGGTKPIQPGNEAKNRRVQFIIVERFKVQ